MCRDDGSPGTLDWIQTARTVRQCQRCGWTHARYLLALSALVTRTTDSLRGVSWFTLYYVDSKGRLIFLMIWSLGKEVFFRVKTRLIPPDAKT